MSVFNAQKARTKYALPIWADALLRDTLDLAADEIGAYHLIFYAMWARETCDFPDDDRKLARVTRTTPQTWKRRIRPALEEFFEVENGVWISRRLRREAVKVEKFLTSQSQRRSGSNHENGANAHHGGAQLDHEETPENSGNALKSNDPVSTTDQSPENPADRPTQETKRPSKGGGGDACAREAEIQTYRERLLKACGADPVSGMTGHGGARLGTRDQMIEADRWISDLGLPEHEILEEVMRLMARKRDGPPRSLVYFTEPMKRLAGQIHAAEAKPMTPENVKPFPNGGRHDRRAEHDRFDETLRETTRRLRAGEIDFGSDDGDPFGG